MVPRQVWSLYRRRLLPAIRICCIVFSSNSGHSTISWHSATADAFTLLRRHASLLWYKLPIFALAKCPLFEREKKLVRARQILKFFSRCVASGAILVAIAIARAGAAELVMFEQAGCRWW